MFKEFKEFAMRGNVIDMAVGVIFGAAFGKIVSSAVSDIVMPSIGLVTGKVDFKNMYVILTGPEGPYPTLDAAQAAGATTLNYGLFLGAVFDFLIIALCLFLFIKMINRLRKQQEEEAPKNKECVFCFTEIPIQAKRCPHCTSELDN